MKIPNGNQVANNNNYNINIDINKKQNKNKKKEKLYHKVVIWNKQSSHLASDNDAFPVIQRAILKHDPNLVVPSEANLSDENFENVKSTVENYYFHYKVIPETKYA